jgi:hypothetical protein
MSLDSASHLQLNLMSGELVNSVCPKWERTPGNLVPSGLHCIHLEPLWIPFCILLLYEITVLRVTICWVPWTLLEIWNPWIWMGTVPSPSFHGCTLRIKWLVLGHTARKPWSGVRLRCEESRSHDLTKCNEWHGLSTTGCPCHNRSQTSCSEDICQAFLLYKQFDWKWLWVGFDWVSF